MNRLMDKCAFSIEIYHQNKCIIGLSQNFVMIDINAKKNVFDIIYPRLKHCNNMFWSEDESKILFLNSTGTAILYDVIKCKVIDNKIHFGDELYNQCFISYRNGYYYLNQTGVVEWFDYETLKKSSSRFSGKYSFLYDDKDKAFFIAIDDFGAYHHCNLLSIKCFSKKTEEFESWSVSLPRGNLNLFRKIHDNYYLIVLEQEKQNEIHTEIYLFNLTNKRLKYLFDEMDFLDNESEEYFVNFEIDITNQSGYVLYSRSLKVIDLNTKVVVNSIPFEETWDLKLVSDILVLATGKGVYKLNVSELKNRKTGDGSLS